MGRKAAHLAMANTSILGGMSRPTVSHFFLGSARASRAACGASPQFRTTVGQQTVGFADVEPVGGAPTGTREGACAPQNL